MAKKYDPAKDHDPLIPLASVPASPKDESAGKKPSRARAVAFTSCPDCTNKRIGLVWAHGHLLYKEHTKATFSGAVMQCRASASQICVNPPHGLIVNGPGERTNLHCSHDQGSARRSTA